MILVGRQQYNILIFPEKYRKKSTALLWSLVIPGAGQSYLKRGSATTLFGVLGYGLIAGSAVTHNKAVQSYDDYLATIIPEQRENLKTDWQSQKKNSETMLYAAGGVWFVNFIWTLATPNEAKRYERMKMNMIFDNVTQTGLLGVNYRLVK